MSPATGPKLGRFILMIANLKAYSYHEKQFSHYSYVSILILIAVIADIVYTTKYPKRGKIGVVEIPTCMQCLP